MARAALVDQANSESQKAIDALSSSVADLTARRDALNHVYDPGATPLVYDVTHDGQVIDIDLPKDLPPRQAYKPPGSDEKKD